MTTQLKPFMLMATADLAESRANIASLILGSRFVLSRIQEATDEITEGVLAERLSLSGCPKRLVAFEQAQRELLQTLMIVDSMSDGDFRTALREIGSSLCANLRKIARGDA